MAPARGRSCPRACRIGADPVAGTRRDRVVVRWSASSGHSLASPAAWRPAAAWSPSSPDHQDPVTTAHLTCDDPAATDTQEAPHHHEIPVSPIDVAGDPRSDAMKVARTGAAGFIGSHVLTELQEHGHQVTALARDEPQAQAIAARGAATVVVDLYDRPPV